MIFIVGQMDKLRVDLAFHVVLVVDSGGGGG